MIGISYNGVSGTAENLSELKEMMGKAEDRVAAVDSTVARSGASLLGKMLQGPKQKPKPPKTEPPDPVDGPLIGRNGEQSHDPDGMSRPRGSRGGWRVPVTRTEAKIEFDDEEQCDKLKLTKIQYDLVMSEKGLVKERTNEHKVWEREFKGNKKKDEGGNGKYGVRPFWTASHDDPERPHLDMLAFGAEANLDTWDGSKFTCNYDEEGNLLPDPPVKIVGTDACGWNPGLEEE